MRRFAKVPVWADKLHVANYTAAAPGVDGALYSLSGRTIAHVANKGEAVSIVAELLQRRALR
jgi:hypothetical protein|tara:strand:+ start:1927 stop:2112 length:186 start_codon:yes stop_codon:yes gene_type:complete